tara:strand:- start:1570 stop:1707 length:138 start_codon:yes stop_codon:yes gene_type:complete
MSAPYVAPHIPQLSPFGHLNAKAAISLKDRNGIGLLTLNNGQPTS